MCPFLAYSTAILSISVFMAGIYVPSDWKSAFSIGLCSPPTPSSCFSSPFPYFTFPSLLPHLPLHSPFPIFFLFSPPLLFLSSTYLSPPFSSLSSPLSLFSPFLSHLLFSFLPLIGNPDWSRCKLEVEENKCRKSINSLEMILSRKRTQ